MAFVGPFGSMSTDQTDGLLECLEVSNLRIRSSRHVRSMFSFVSILVLSRDDIEVATDNNTVSIVSPTTNIKSLDVPM